MQNIRSNPEPHQYDNLKGKFTNHHLTYLLDSILKGLDQPPQNAQVALLDFRNAFDFVDHSVAITDCISSGAAFICWLL